MIRQLHPKDLAGLAIRGAVGREVACGRDRDVVVELEADVGSGVLEHVGVAVGEDRQPASRPESVQRLDHVRERT